MSLAAISLVALAIALLVGAIPLFTQAKVDGTLGEIAGAT